MCSARLRDLFQANALFIQSILERTLGSLRCNSPRSAVHRDASRPHLDVFIPCSHSNRQTASSAEDKAQSPASPPRAAQQLQEQKSDEHLRSTDASKLPGASQLSEVARRSGNCPALQRNDASADGRAANSRSVCSDGATNVSFWAAMIEHIRPISPLLDDIEQRKQQHQQHQQPEQPCPRQSPRQRLLKQGTCAMRKRSPPPEQMLISSSVDFAPAHLQPSDASSSAIPANPALCAQAASLSQSLRRSSSADWSLATEVLLRKTRSECCTALLRRHYSRQLHAVTLHWRLLCVRSPGAADAGRHSPSLQDGGKDLGGAAVQSSCCDAGAICADSKRSVGKRVTWDYNPPLRSTQVDVSSSSGDVGISAAALGRGRIAAACRSGGDISLSAAWNANVAAAAAAFTSESNARCPFN